MKIELPKIQEHVNNRLVNMQVHPDFDWLQIYNYSHKCQIDRAWDETTMQCRGLIIDTRDNSIVARPFPKFFNLDEKEHDIPNEIPLVYDTLDGSLGIIYWVEDKPMSSTRGSYTSEQAKYATKYFNENADFNEYDRSKTYLFEIIYPANRIVVGYDWQGLILLAVRDTKTGQDAVSLPKLSNIRLVDTIPFKSMEELKELETDNAEGFVVFYPSTGLRIKLKFEEYKRLHRIVTNVTPRSIWDALRNGSDLNEILERVPDEFYKWVKNWETRLKGDYNSTQHEALIVHDHVKDLPTRKEQALRIMELNKKHASVVFSMLDNQDYSQIIWKGLKPKAEDVFKEEI